MENLLTKPDTDRVTCLCGRVGIVNVNGEVLCVKKMQRLDAQQLKSVGRFLAQPGQELVTNAVGRAVMLHQLCQRDAQFLRQIMSAKPLSPEFQHKLALNVAMGAKCDQEPPKVQDDLLIPPQC